MADQLPVKANLVSGVPFSLGQFGTGDTVPVTSGGTGAITAQIAINTLTNSFAAGNEYVLTKDTSTGYAIFKPATGGGGAVTSVNGQVGIVVVTPTLIGLDQVNNTSDANKPLSNATITALAGKQATLVSTTNIKTINGSSILGSGDLVVSGGGGTFTAAGAGAVTRTVQNKERDIVSVMDYGAAGDGTTNDSAAFQAAINALPAEGGKILVPDHSYNLSTTPTWGAKSIYWDIGTGCIFSGTGTGSGKFPYMFTNIGQLAVGPWIQSNTTQTTTLANGGIAAFNVEMIQPASAGGLSQNVGIYVGSKGSSSNGSANVWAINSLIEADAGAAGFYQCIEADVNNYSTSATVVGVSITGIGTSKPFAGMQIIRAAGPNWIKGLDLYNCDTGIVINTTLGVGVGIAIGPTAAFTNTPIIYRQQVTGGDGIVGQRLNSSGTGTFIRGVNENNTVQLFGIDCYGNFNFAGTGQLTGFLTANGGVGTTQMFLSTAAGSAPAGVLCLGNGLFGSASAGGNVLPSNPYGFISCFIGPTAFKIPIYNN